MEEIIIKDISKENIEDICWICTPPREKENPDFIKGIEEKKRWSEDMLQTWGSFAKIAYIDNNKAGFMQFEPVPEERIISIDCIYVPRKDHWQKGVATKLLSSLIDDMKETKKYFDNKRPLALVTKTFPGGGKEQLSAREFYKKKGFKQIGEDPDFLYYPLEENFVYKPAPTEEKKYILQEEDKGKVLIVCGPINCPFTYPYFLKCMEKYIREIDSEIPIRWIDASENPEEVKKRNIDVQDCIVNAKQIKAVVADKDKFQKEVREALETNASL